MSWHPFLELAYGRVALIDTADSQDQVNLQANLVCEL